MQGDRFSWRARARSFKYALQGIATLIRDEHNARIHLVAAVLAIALAAILRVSATAWCIIILLIAAVFALEALNTAIEAICDKVAPEFQPLIKKAKDTAAAAVLFMAIAAVIIGAIIFIPEMLYKCS